MSLRRLFCSFALLATVFAGVCDILAANDNLPKNLEETNRETPLEASNTWIVVNLFTGRSSKQAVIVRDKLIGAGAQGQGIILPYNEITIENMKKLRPAFLALSPNGIPWCKYRGRNGEELQDFFQGAESHNPRDGSAGHRYLRRSSGIGVGFWR